MEKNNSQITNSEVNSKILSNSPLVENQQLVFTEHDNYFRVTKPNSFLPRNGCEGNNKQAQDYKVNIHRSDNYDLTYDPTVQTNSSFDQHNQNTSFKLNKKPVPQLTWRNNIGSQKFNDVTGISQNTTINKYSDSKSFSFSTNDQDQSKTVNFQINRRETNQDQNRIHNFNLREEDKAHHENMDGRKESEEAYVKLSTGITKLLQQQQLKTQEHEQIFDYQQRNRAIENTRQSQLVKKQNTMFIKNALQGNQLEGNISKYNQAESRGNQTSIIISENKNEPQLIKRTHYSTNTDQISYDYRKEHFMERKENYYLKSNNYDMQFRNRVSGHVNKGFSTGINDVNWAVAKAGNSNEANYALNMQYPLFYPQYFLPKMYQYWPGSNLGYTNPSIDILNHQNNWWSLMQPTYQSPLEICTEGNTINHAPLQVLRPYSGIAGYNWPTIRKPLKSTEPEEKNDYPVYVKPPVIGSEETEQLRDAYIKYVKWLRYKLYQKDARKQKQLERRERNFKLRFSKITQMIEDFTLGADRGEGKTYSQNVHHCQKNSEDLQPCVPDSTKINENTFNSPSEADSWFMSSYTDSVSTDIPNTVPESGFPFETFQNKSMENYSKDSDQSTSNERPLKDLVDLATEPLDKSEHDLLREASSRITNQPTDYYSTKEQRLQSSIHPIFGPVCSWKEAFFDENETSNVPNELDK